MEIDERPTHLDLFAGGGGFTIAAEKSGFHTIGFSEVNPYANKWLKYRWPEIPNIGDIRTINDVHADLVTGGVPCQPSSTAGAQLGSADERWLWPDAIRVMRVSGCSVAVFENPPGIFTVEGGRAFNGIISSISSLGYSVWWETLPACSVGAPHRRERVFIIAVSDRVRWDSRALERSGIQRGEFSRYETDSGIKEGIAPNTQRIGRRKRVSEEPIFGEQNGTRKPQRAFKDFNGGWDLSAPTICNMDDGIPFGLAEYQNRIRLLGNSVVPQVAYEILKPIHDMICLSPSEVCAAASGKPK